jgi:hypothetical protein
MAELVGGEAPTDPRLKRYLGAAAAGSIKQLLSRRHGSLPWRAGS